MKGNKTKNTGIKKGKKLQSAIDFMVSYGVMLLVLAIVLYALYLQGVFNPNLVASNCTAVQSFKCIAYTIKANGTVFISFQSLYPGSITINGIGCSTQVNATGNGPRYGNIDLLSPAIAPQYYPLNSNVITAGGGATELIQVKCYNGSGLATSKLGVPFAGYIWLNYTYSELPSTTHVVVQAFSFTIRYE